MLLFNMRSSFVEQGKILMMKKIHDKIFDFILYCFDNELYIVLFILLLFLIPFVFIYLCLKFIFNI